MNKLHFIMNVYIMQLMQYFINIENVSAYEIYALNCSQKIYNKTQNTLKILQINRYINKYIHIYIYK